MPVSGLKLVCHNEWPHYNFVCSYGHSHQISGQGFINYVASCYTNGKVSSALLLEILILTTSDNKHGPVRFFSISCRSYVLSELEFVKSLTNSNNIYK